MANGFDQTSHFGDISDLQKRVRELEGKFEILKYEFALFPVTGRQSASEYRIMGFTMSDLINFRRICDTYNITSFEIGETLAGKYK